MTAEEKLQRLLELGSMGRVYGGMDYAQGDTTPWLIQLCHAWVKQSDVMVEVGCYKGVSTRVFACFAGLVYAVDPWTLAGATYRDLSREKLEEAESEFISATRSYPNIARIQDFSVAAALNFKPASLDAVYIDADHSEGAFAADVRAWLPKLKPSGLLMGHDYSQVGNYFEGLGLPKPVATYPEDSWVIRVEDVA